jgi:hypothetical protein
MTNDSALPGQENASHRTLEPAAVRRSLFRTRPSRIGHPLATPLTHLGTLHQHIT